MERVVIPLSRGKILLLLGAALLFVGLGYSMFSMDAAEIVARGRRGESPLFIHGLGVVSMAFGAAGAVPAILKLMDPSPGLVLDARGFMDNTGPLAAGFIPWSEVTGFETQEIHKQRLLYILLKEPGAFIQRFGAAQRSLMKANARIDPSPIAINSNPLAIRFDELVSLMQQYHAAWWHSAANGQGGSAEGNPDHQRLLQKAA